MQFFVSVFLFVCALIVIREIMPAIILAVVAFILIKVFTPVPVRELDARAATEQPGIVQVVSIVQTSDRTVTANIKNGLKARIFNLRLSCEGGVSYRSTRGYIQADETSGMAFTMRAPGTFKNCDIGYDFDQDDLSRALGHAKNAKAFRDTITARNDLGRVTILGEIQNFKDQPISSVSLICYFTRDGVDAQYPIEVPMRVEPRANGQVNAIFTLPGQSQGGVLCRANSVSYGGIF